MIFSYLLFDIFNLLHQNIFLTLLFFGPALFFDTTRYFLTNLFYFVFWIFRADKQNTLPTLSNFPFVSVIIPVYKEQTHLHLSLRSIFENNYPNFEVIIVNDGDSEFIHHICSEFQRKGKIIYLKKDHRGGKPSSLNYGLQFARGEIVFHLDGDSTLNRDAILEAVKLFSDPRVGGVAGHLKVLNQNENWVTRLQAAEYAICIGVQRRWLDLTDTLQIASGAFSCFRKKILLSLYGTDPDEGEDLDISLKVRKLGYKIAFAAKAIGYTRVPDSWRGLFAQRFRWDRCYIRLNLRKHGNLLDLRRFRKGDFIAGVSDFTFNVIFLIVLPIYILCLAFLVPQFIFPIFLLTFLFYTLLNLFQFVIVFLISSDPRKDAIFLLYAPLFFFYASYLRVIRTLAYFREFFSKKVIRNSYFPEHVWENMPRY